MSVVALAAMATTAMMMTQSTELAGHIESRPDIGWPAIVWRKYQ